MTRNGLTRYNHRSGALTPLGLSGLFSDDFFNWVDEVFRDFGVPAFRQTFEGYPVANVKANEKGDVRIEVAVTGYDQDSVRVEIEDGVLTVSAVVDECEGPNGCDRDGFKPIHSRIKTGSFERRWHIPKELDSERAKASIKNGLLTIDVPIREDAKPAKRQIEIQK